MLPLQSEPSRRRHESKKEQVRDDQGMDFKVDSHEDYPYKPTFLCTLGTK